MIHKRFVGVVTVRDGWAVQSFGYNRWLPLGRPETLVENLDRWGADEILLQVTDRSRRGQGPDFDLLERIAKLGLATPLVYAGGIRGADDARDVIHTAADRVCVDALLHDDLPAALAIREQIGAQGIIAALPLAIEDGDLRWLDARTGKSRPLDPALVDGLADGAISEALVIDWRGEGSPGGFDPALLDGHLPANVPLIAFGGLSNGMLLRRVLSHAQVAAVALGNFLTYREHAVQAFKRELAGLPVRPAMTAGAGY
ncbi:HisA/HisF-related TIM barrel protein [Sphingomonas sp. LT1P40]|uniref:HisA/HisF-related TIM barrel protein n=1 Tax=Alteristakelama amylovorans TaxID=3096166 RepID=UPI002FC6FE7B